MWVWVWGCVHNERANELYEIRRHVLWDAVLQHRLIIFAQNVSLALVCAGVGPVDGPLSDMPSELYYTPTVRRCMWCVACGVGRVAWRRWSGVVEERKEG